MDFRDQIKEFRRRKGIFQRDLAALVGIDQPHMSRIESGKHTPSSRIRKKLENILGEHLIGEFRGPWGKKKVIK